MKTKISNEKVERINIRNCPIDLKRKLEQVKSERRGVSIEKLVIEALILVYMPEKADKTYVYLPKE